MPERAGTTTVTEWGVRWTSGSGSHVDNYGNDEAGARQVIMTKAHAGMVLTLQSRMRTTTVTEWTESR